MAEESTMLATSRKSFVTRALARLGSENAFRSLARARETRSDRAAASCTWRSASRFRYARTSRGRRSIRSWRTHALHAVGRHSRELRDDDRRLRVALPQNLDRRTRARTSSSRRAQSRLSGTSSRRFSIRATIRLLRSRVPGVRFGVDICRPTSCAFRCSNRATGAWISTNSKAAFRTKRKRS